MKAVYTPDTVRIKAASLLIVAVTLTADAQRSFWLSLEARKANILIAAPTVAIISGLDGFQCGLDLDQSLL